VLDILLACCDGLTGLPEAVNAAFLHVTGQTCVVHLIPGPAPLRVQRRPQQGRPPGCAGASTAPPHPVEGAVADGCKRLWPLR
jgi:hypothetical protein